jgi:hypothetical protein
MEIFLVSFAVYIVTALALGIGILFRGHAMHAGCRGLPDRRSCKSTAPCGSACRRVR